MRYRDLSRLLLLLLLSLVFAAAGCGDDDDEGGGDGGGDTAAETTDDGESEEDELEAFIEEAEEICEDVDTESGTEFGEVFQSYVDPETSTELSDVVAAADEVIEDSEETFEAFEELEPPSEVEDDWAELIELQQKLLNDFEDIRDLADSRRTASTSFREDVEALTEAFQSADFEDTTEELNELAEEIGIEECAA